MKNKIIEILNEFKAPYNSDGVYVNAINEDDFPAIVEKIEALDNWVSVEEGLPELKEDIQYSVLIFNTYGKCMQAMYNTLTEEFLDMQFIPISTYVTHWQPLPKPKTI